MKNVLVLCIVAVLSLSCVPSPEGNTAVVSEDSIVIDVRTAGEFDSGHLEAAVNIPYDQIADRIADHVTDKEAEIMLYCRSGRRSAIAKKTLDGLGYLHVTDGGSYATLKSQADAQQ